MLLRIQRFRKHQEGQAIVLAALGLLILAIGVLATLNLGHAVKERIRLQNVADATAYSLAALEARSFNFMAFVNRAQVSHYVSAMSFQSWLAVVWFVDGLLGLTTDFLGTFVTTVCLCKPIPYVGAACAALEGALRPIHEILKQVASAWRKIAQALDSFVGKIAIGACSMLNQYGMYGAQKMMKTAVLAAVADSGFAIAKENDPRLKRSHPWFLVTGALNLEEYSGLLGGNSGVFDEHAEKLSKNNLNGPEEIEQARRVMTETANASRYGVFLTNRSLEGLLSKIPGFGNIPPGMLSGFGPTGQTRLIDQLGDSPREKRFGSQFGHAQMAKGNVLVADEVMEFGFSGSVPGNLDPISWLLRDDQAFSVWAAQNAGYHYVYKPIARLPMPPCGEFVIPGFASAKDPENHPWEGIVPYVKFRPDASDRYFNQPSTYSFLNLSPEDLGGGAFVQDFNFKFAGRTESLDTRIGEKPIIAIDALKGINAWSRAMVYYHRPSAVHAGQVSSNWKEHPNFFNPFWRAKLAPIGEKLADIMIRLGFPSDVSQVLADQMVTH